jgi:hypothetical protein
MIQNDSQKHELLSNFMQINHKIFYLQLLLFVLEMILFMKVLEMFLQILYWLLSWKLNAGEALTI